MAPDRTPSKGDPRQPKAAGSSPLKNGIQATEIPPGGAVHNDDPSSEKVMLQAEVKQLERCLKSATVKVTQIYKSCLHKQRLASTNGIKYSPYPNSSLLRSLGSDIALYDDYCDIIEFKLARAIAATRRDIANEEERLAKAALAQLALAADTNEDSLMEEPTAGADQPVIPVLPPNVQMGIGLAGPMNAANLRRPAISLSRGPRQGAPFPLKLDLSAATLRMGDSMIPGLFSPVTLAPKTGKPPASAIEQAPDAADLFGPDDLANGDSIPGLDGMTIDLTGDDPTSLNLGDGGTMPGSTSDMPIVLDMGDSGDMESLFGDVTSAVEVNAPRLPLPELTASQIPSIDVSAGADTLFPSEHDSSQAMDDQMGDPSSLLSVPNDVLNASVSSSSLGIPTLDDSLTDGSGQGQLGMSSDYDQLSFNPFSPSMFEGLGEDEAIPGLDGDIIAQLLDSQNNGFQSNEF